MDSAEMEEEFSEWQQIQYSSQSLGTDTIAAKEPSLLPPSHNESPLEPPSPPPPPPSPPDSPSSESSSSLSSDNASNDDVSMGKYSLLLHVINLAKKHLNSSRIGLTVKQMCNYLPSGTSFWSFSPVNGLLLLSLVGLVFARLKMNRLIVLIKEKDQKIRQLAIQIARLNQLLSSRRKVQVVRIA